MIAEWGGCDVCGGWEEWKESFAREIAPMNFVTFQTNGLLKMTRP